MAMTWNPVSPHNKEEAEANLLGYLWNDGFYVDAGWCLFKRTARAAMRIEACCKILGLPCHVYESNQDPTKFNIKLFGIAGGTILHDHVPQVAFVASKWFLASCLECEGSKDGLIMDDPSVDHLEAMKEFLSEALGIESSISGDFFKSLWNRSDLSKYEDLPVTGWGRVPGGRPDSAK